MSGRKRRRWYFRDPKFQTFQGKYTPRWGAFVALTFLPLRAPSKSHATLLWLLTQGWKKRLGLEGVVGGGVYFKDCYCQGGTISRICNYLGGNVLIHHTVLKNPAPLWDVINDRSLNVLANFRLNFLIKECTTHDPQEIKMFGWLIGKNKEIFIGYK